MTPSEKITAAKDIFSIAAAICVAIWAMYSAWVKKEERISDLRVLELEQKTSLRSHLMVDMNIESLSNGENFTIVAISVQLRNNGNEDVRVMLNDRSILLSYVQFEEDKVNYKDVKYIGNSRFIGKTKLVGPFVDIGSNETYQMSYVARISKPGTYLVRFLSQQVSESVGNAQSKNLGDHPAIYYAVGTDKYLHVE